MTKIINKSLGDIMTNREKEILELVKSNPFITQEEIARILNIARSSVAVHITNLIKKGYILGRGYIINEKDYVVVIGGANIDINGFSKGILKMKDSNPGKLNISLGGVGRNIAENIARMNINVKMITALGKDMYGEKILEHSKNIGIDMKDSIVLNDYNTSTYLAIIDENGDMAVALSDMDACDKIDIGFIKSKKKIIEKAKLCVIDTNIPEESIKYLVNNFNVAFFLDTVSTSKAKKVKDIVGKFHTIKPNRLEAEVLTGVEIRNDNDAKTACKILLEKGVKNVFLTLGKDGVICANKKELFKISIPEIKVINATGAGDAFLAGLVYSYLNNYSLRESVVFAIGASVITLSSKDTISDELSVENIKLKIKELGLC
nr:PfkB family carbohydrate kinase [Marinitoga sp. 1154]